MSLQRFLDAQKADYATALAEVSSGRKRSHWIWYIFPQIHGLGRSRMADYYAIRNLDEARAFAADPVLGAHLTQISRALLALPGGNAHAVFGSPDDLKVRSCMTLFEVADPSNLVYAQVLERFYGGERDQLTLDILEADARLAPAQIADRQVYQTRIGPVCMSRTEHAAYVEELERRSGSDAG